MHTFYRHRGFFPLKLLPLAAARPGTAGKYDKLNPTVSKAAAAHHVHWRSPCLSQDLYHHLDGPSMKSERLSRPNEAGVD